MVGFGDKGIAVIESTIGSLSSARRVEELADGRLLVIGEINRVAAAMRFEKDGRVDVTFGSNGVVIIGGALGQSLAFDLVELDDGSSLICGWSFSPRGYWLIKLDGRGALDTTFGLDGKTILTVPNGSAPLTGGVARFVSSDANGVTLSLWDQAIFNRLVRIGIDGSVDETFGEFGWYNSGLRRYTAYGDPSGGIMFYSSSGPTIKKLNADLTVALGFGEDGVVSIPFSEGQVEIAEVLFDEHGGMVGVGNVNYVGGVFFRVTSEGMPPLSFQDGGLADWVDVDTALSGASAKSMELLPDGSMIGVGAANSGIQIVRVGGTGLRSRNSLGGDGSARVYGADGLYLLPNDSTVAEDGNLIVVGAAGGGRWFILKRTIGLQPQIRLRNESNAAISRAAPTIEFGQVTVGPQVTRTFSVGSDNAEFVRNVRVELVDDGGGAFSVSALDVSVILSGEWLPLEVSFTALDALPRQGTLLVHSNDPEGPFAIRLTGEGPGPDLEVLDESNESLGSTVPFGSGDIGVSLSRTVTLKNAGQLALANLSVSVSGADVAAFAVDGLDGTTLGAGESLVLDLTFTPSAYRQHDAVFEIGSDDPDEPLITVSMTGKGLPPAWPSGSLKLVSAEGETLSSDGLGLYFGLVGVGQSLTRAMTVTNIGTVPINGLESSVVGGGGFASAGLASPTLNPGETVPLSATFTPTSPGGKLAVLSFTTHGGMNPVAEFSLSGSAISTLDVWRLAKFGGLANAGDAADAADIDLDGLANLMEFVTRRDPGVRDGVVTDIRADDPAEFDFCFTRDKASISSVRQFVEWSETLASDSWSEEGVVATIINDNGVVQEMCFTIPKGESGRRFVRLRLERIR